MTEFLLFRLYGPMASWGQIAPGEVRASWAAPSKSAILGLIGAALGLDRADDDAHARLHDTLGFAVELRNPGLPLKDYHTAQTPEGKGPWLNRAHELRHDKLKTILSDRDYYLEQESVPALWARGASAPALAELVGALQAPKFVLYLGRKSCPPALPLEPKIVTAATVQEAFAAYIPSMSTQDFGGHAARGNPRIYADRDAPGVQGTAAAYTSRRDGLAKRSRWRFADRAEAEFTREVKP
ncbi:MAG TPA: type I-E CRISPR-associated protein Cas5/CasD [Alphaproteobacteria bacterium]|nr:type I-E CRISPR-associated protein Cas5/CasD [Alphaproteobacteria bacterium]